MIEKEHDKFWELVAAHLHKETSVREEKELELLLKQDKALKEYKRTAELKEEVSVIKELSGISQQKSWDKVATHVKGKVIRKLWSLTKYAAIIVVALLLGNVLTNQWNKQHEITGFAEVKVPLGQMSELSLPDGSKVWLNSGTTIRYANNFGRESRNVQIKGEAFFDVEKSKMPFKVQFKGKEVEVLGTQFNVVAYDDENFSQVVLVEGSVQINAPNGSNVARLKPSEQIHIDELVNQAKITKVETGFYVSWTEGKIVFEEEKLSNITARLERWYNVDIHIEDEEIKNLKFSGTILKNKPFDQITAAFELLLPVKIEYTHVLGEQDKVIISKK